jgi:hypothetical protein
MIIKSIKIRKRIKRIKEKIYRKKIKIKFKIIENRMSRIICN